MKHRLRPSMEALESKALLSYASGASTAIEPLARAALHAHVRPSETSVRVGHLKVTLATDFLVYQPGQVVHITLTETNITSGDVTVAYGPSIDGFSITQNGRLIWRSGPAPQFIVRQVLAPGQSAAISANWTVGQNMSGAFVVHSRPFPQLTTAFRVESASSSGSTST